jgi:aminobenzoyl-glutamate utilization protein B
VVPTTELTAATYVPGTAPHSWQAIASGASGIGPKGMRVAAKALAMTAVDLLTDPALVAAARAAHAEATGPGYVYRSLVGDREPPLDYRQPAR